MTTVDLNVSILVYNVQVFFMLFLVVQYSLVYNGLLGTL